MVIPKWQMRKKMKICSIISFISSKITLFSSHWCPQSPQNLAWRVARGWPKTNHKTSRIKMWIILWLRQWAKEQWRVYHMELRPEALRFSLFSHRWHRKAWRVRVVMHSPWGSETIRTYRNNLEEGNSSLIKRLRWKRAIKITKHLSCALHH